MTDVFAVRLLAEQCVGHGHADDALEALLGDTGCSSKVCIANRVARGHKVEDVVLTEPVKAGDVLKLWIMSTS